MIELILGLFGFVAVGTLIELIVGGGQAWKAKKEWEEHQRKLPPLR